MGRKLFILTNPTLQRKYFSWVKKKTKTITFWVALTFFTHSISRASHFGEQIQIIVASFGSLVTRHHVHNFNDLYSEVVEQWSPPRDLEVSEACVHKTQLVAGLETSVGWTWSRWGKGGGWHDDHVYTDLCGHFSNMAASDMNPNKRLMLGKGWVWRAGVGLKCQKSPSRGTWALLCCCYNYRTGAKTAGFSGRGSSQW